MLLLVRWARSCESVIDCSVVSERGQSGTAEHGRLLSRYSFERLHLEHLAVRQSVFRPVVVRFGSGGDDVLDLLLEAE